MARNKQKLINYHGSGDLPSNLLENLDLGEIAVKHSTNGTAQLVIKTGSNNDSTSKAIFVESAGVVSMINESISSVAGNVEEIARSLSAVSTTTVSAITALADEIIFNGEFHQEVRENLSGHVATLTTNLSENYWTTATTQGKLDAITGDMSTLDTRLTGRITSLSSATEALSASVYYNYAKKSEVATAKDEAINSSKTYTDAVSGYIATTLTNNYYDKNTIDGKFETTNGNVTQLGTRIGNAETAISALSDSITTMGQTYATKDYVHQLSGEAITAAKNYTNTISGQVLSEVADKYYNKTEVDDIVTGITDNITTLGTRIGNAETAISGLSGSVSSMTANLKSYIDDKLSVVYKFKGTKETYAQLPTTGNENGDVWNVESAQGTMGEPGYVPAGTNYAWNADESKWDALGGTIDLSVYATSADTDSLQTQITNVAGDLQNLSDHVSSMTVNYATTAQVATAKAEAITSAQNYTNTVSGYIATTLTGNYWTTATTQGKLNAITGDMSTLDTRLTGRITSLSSATEALSASVYYNYAKKSEVATAKAEAISSSKTYTDAVSGYIATTLTGSYWTSATTQGKLDTITGDVSKLAGRVSDTEGDIEALSTQTMIIEATANAALNAFTLDTVSNAGSTQSGAKAAYTAGGGAVLDLSELVIDCGNW